MLRRSLFVSALMLAGVVGFASSAKPMDQPMKFTTTIDASCNLTTSISGDFEGKLTANPTKSMLATTESAYVGIDCTGGDLSISEPLPDGSNPPLPTGVTANYTAQIKTAGGTIVTDTDGVTALATDGSDDGEAEVTMEASLPTGEFTAGDYGYTVTVTATP